MNNRANATENAKDFFPVEVDNGLQSKILPPEFEVNFAKTLDKSQKM